MNLSYFAKGAFGITALIVLAIAGFWLSVHFQKPQSQKPAPEIPALSPPHVQEAVIGHSVQNRPISAYTYGRGGTRLLFVGGMHGGYEWNSVLLAYTFRDYLEASENIITPNLSITVIPDINPDAVFATIGKDGPFTLADVPLGKDLSTERFNADKVDLNRNFDCKWQPTGTWKGNKVSAGISAFSEPETQALRDFIQKIQPRSVVFWHSQANAVYASECTHGILPETLQIMDSYASAAKYPAIKSFDAYPVTGDAEGWLASIGIPAITVELSSHDSIEWDRNLAGIKALITHFALPR